MCIRDRSMHQLSFGFGILLVSDRRTAGLEILKIGTRTDFHISAIRRHPNLNIICFCTGKTKISGTKGDYPVRKT